MPTDLQSAPQRLVAALIDRDTAASKAQYTALAPEAAADL